ncbi:MAG TPA: malic enzyme-like NAD(P)-binding protein [Chloroflexota bacterium]|nr:malic enzyme-like NAD(P)-binding protein [Chloroflexota bacterium]
MTAVGPSASYSIIVRCRINNRPGMLGRLTTAVGAAGGDMGAIDIVRQDRDVKIRDLTINCRDDAHGRAIVDAMRAVPGIEVVNVSDRTFLLHLGGKIEVTSKAPLRTRDDLSMAYTPGVARVCRAIAQDPASAFNLTIKRNTVAVVSDGTAILGLGDLGPLAAMPVMEGKAMLFKEFGKVDAFPICLDTKDADEIVETVTRLAPAFGGINLEDIAAPRCFEIEERLKARLDIPVFHDDQHGTAVVTLAALLNACRLVGKPLDSLRVVVNGVGAAGVAVTKILLASGVREIIGCDRAGAIYEGRTDNMNAEKERYAAITNPRRLRGALRGVIADADVFIGVSAPGALTVADVQRMAPDPIVFALANPDPEILPEEVADVARVMATGRSDYPNQINNVLCFPGIFRGALDVQARSITEEMKLAAARAIASIVADDELSDDYIIPSVFNRRVAEAVAAATAEAAVASGVARRAVAPAASAEVAEVVLSR